ncbi:MAG: helix-turn-helix transcriptional regulator [Proteobacteria bacterium]|nr:helix-turn-helix transcriptional regulator [Pseudomonadota bacterium]MBS0573721.1 helix-turn-helix transcriptional regulator [Pseudomonadota bacterium]
MTELGNPPRRRYDEGCIAAHALDVLGDRWALLVIRELLLGSKRFGAIRAGLPGISANILTQRLEGLEGQGVLVRRTLPAPASVQVYELTALGLAVRPVIEALCRWGVQLPGHDPRRFISPTALMLSMAAVARPGNGPDLAAGFRLDGESFAMTVRGGRCEVVRGEAPAAMEFSGGANAAASAIYGPRPLREAVAGGLVAFSGDLDEGQRFVDLFSLRA